MGFLSTVRDVIVNRPAKVKRHAELKAEIASLEKTANAKIAEVQAKIDYWENLQGLRLERKKLEREKEKALNPLRQEIDVLRLELIRNPPEVVSDLILRLQVEIKRARHLDPVKEIDNPSRTVIRRPIRASMERYVETLKQRIITANSLAVEDLTEIELKKRIAALRDEPLPSIAFERVTQFEGDTKVVPA